MPNGETYVISRDPVTGVYAVSHSSINVIAAAASIAAGLGGAGIAFSGAAAVAVNVVLTKTNAYIAASKITAATDVTIGAAQHRRRSPPRSRPPPSRSAAAQRPASPRRSASRSPGT